MSTPGTDQDGNVRAYRFDPFELRPHSRELLRDGCPVELQPKVFDLIAYLLTHRGRAVDKNELLEAVWPRQVVTDAALSRCVMKARRALDDSGENPQQILTVHGRGYRFAGTVTPVSDLRLHPRAPDGGPGQAPDTAWGTAPAAAHAAAQPADDAAAIPSFEARIPAPAEAPRPTRHTLRLAGLLGLLLALAAGWWLWQRPAQPPAHTGNSRIAVMPVENATGDARYDWARLGLMNALGEVLRSHGIAVVGAREVLELEEGLQALPPPERLARLRRAYAVSHVVWARLEKQGTQLRLTYAFAGLDGRPRQRTVVAADATALSHAVGADIGASLGRGGERMSLAGDSFANEAHLRGLALRLQGDIASSLEYFRLAAAQAPDAFWPRYELALAQRDLGEYDSARGTLTALLEESDAGGDARHSLAARNGLAILAWRTGDTATAAQLLNEGLRFAEVLEDPDRRASIRTNLGILATYRGDYAAAHGHLQAAMEAEAEAGLEQSSGNVLNSLGQLALREGDLAAAGQLMEAALARFRLIGSRRNEATVLNGLANLRQREGRLEEALELSVHTLALHRELGNPSGEISALSRLAATAASLGRLQEALGYGEEALTLAERIGERPAMGLARSLLGRMHLDRGDTATARTLLEHAHEDMLAVDDPVEARRQRLYLARVDLAEDAPAAAERQLRSLLQEVRAHGPPPLLGAVLGQLARAQLARGAPDAAWARIEEALAAAEPLGDPVATARLQVLAAEIALARGETATAARMLASAAPALPRDPDPLRARASLAAAEGDHVAALAHERAAREAAGERWGPHDEARLAARERRSP